MSFGSDILEPFLRDMSGGLGSFFGLNVTDVLKSPEEYSPQAAQLMDTIAATVVSPVASTVLVVLYVLELNRIALRSDGDGEVFLKTAFFTLLKFVLIKIAFDNVDVIMGGIYEVLAGLASQANLTGIAITGIDGGSTSAFLDSVDEMDWLAQTLLVIVMLVAWLVNRGAVIVALALVVVRFVKLFIFTAFAPMPIAFFASQDTRQYAIGFLRNFAGVVLQAFALVLAFAVYQAVSSGWGATAFDDLDTHAVTAALSIGGTYIFQGVVLAMIVLGSGRIANEILGN